MNILLILDAVTLVKNINSLHVLSVDVPQGDIYSVFRLKDSVDLQLVYQYGYFSLISNLSNLGILSF